MIHDPDLLDKLATFSVEIFEGTVFRATRLRLDPLAYSASGGRWMVPGEFSVLYTSLAADGAMAEISYHWSQLTPIPSKPVVLHELSVSARKSRRILKTHLPEFGVDVSRYQELDYRRTQEIGAAVAFLGCDGLIVPSARWDCENLILFNDNYSLDADLKVISSTTRDWKEWCRSNGRNLDEDK